MKSDKEKNDFYEETKHRGCLQECSQILYPPVYIRGTAYRETKKDPYPAVQIRKIQKFFCYYQLLAGSLPAATSSATFCCSCLIF